MASIPLDTVRKTRGKSPLRAISPARLHDLLSITPKSLRKASKNEKTNGTTPARKLLQFDDSIPSTATTPVSQVGSQKLYEQLSQHFRAFTGQLFSVQRKMCDVLRACGKEIEQSDLAPHVLVTHQYAFANQESNPHAPLMRAYTLYITRIQPLLLQASTQARAPYNKQLRSLAAALFLSGHHYKGLLMLKDILTIFEKDLDIECAYQKWCVLLAEWEVLNEFYDEKNNMFTRDKFIEHSNFASVCQQIKVFHVDTKFREHSIQQLYQYLEERKDEKTYANYELMALINSCLANAYKLQRREVKDDARLKTKDGLVHLEQMLHCSEVIVKNMARNLLVDSSTNYELPLFDTEGKDSGHILKVSLRVAEHFYFVHQYVLEMFKSGQTREACYASLKYWIASLRLGLHPNIVRASSLMFWVRFASFYDSHSRPNMRKILQHLYNDSVVQPEGEMKTAKQGVADMTMGALTDTFLELCINEDDTSNPILHLYAETCSCSNCSISRFDPIYRFEWHIFAFAYDGFPTNEAAVQGLCEAFTQLRFLNTPTQQKLLGHLSKPRPPLLMSMLWMLVMIQWLRYNDGYRAPRAGAPVITTVTEWTKKIYKYASSFLQAEFLALAQASRPACPPLCYSWMLAKSAKRKLLQSHPKTTEDGELAAKREKAVDDARKQYALHKHLMYRDWRLPICSMIAQLSIYPWESAMMSAEMCLLATRQAARAIGRDFGEEFRSASQFQAKVEKMPEDITVLQLVLNNSGDFVVVKLHCSRPPVIVPIASKDKLDEFIKDMTAIMRDNDTTGNLAKVTTDSKYFWKERRRVDDALRVFCAKVQNQLLGPFAMLFRPSATLGTEGRKAAKMIQSLTTKAQTNKGLSSYIAAELVSLFATGSHEEYETLWKPLIPAFCELNGELGSAEAAKVSRTNSDFYVQLKKAASDVAYSFPRYTMIVASPELSIIPWESLPIFEKNPYIGRFGSVHKLLEIFEKKNYSIPRAINPARGVFICDPDNNLDDTKKRMCDHMAKLGWTGIVGRVPEPENFKNMLSANDIYVYLGHGSGSKYFGRTAVRKSGCQAVGFLMGCSSVAITPEGPGLDGRSSIYDYFIADSPCVVGCLWMVTDGEIDRYFIDLSDYMFDAEQRKPKANDGERLRMLMDGMAFARSRAKLRHLTGASVVSYGIPVVTSPSNGLDSAAKG